MIDAIIILILLVICYLIVRRFVKNKAKGISSSCGCGCSSCPSSSVCHGAVTKKDK